MTAAQQLLGGRYALGAVLGRGGMAEVLRATDTRLGRAVAVKVLREDLAQDPAFQVRFRHEAQAAASLDAPAVVAVYDTGQDERGVPWIVMELVDGRTLREVLHEEGRLLPQRALEVVAEVCSALEVAHAAGMVHRDIKPANVMLSSRGEVKVMDFGIARAAAASSAAMTQTAAVIGTVAYLSPEQARGEPVDGRSDLYSTGCLLYELVTGVPPFVGDSPLAVAYQHVQADPVPPTDYDPSMSGDVDALVLKAMAKNPDNRYQSAREMRADLLRAVAGESVRATPVLPRHGSLPVTAGGLPPGTGLRRPRGPRLPTGRRRPGRPLPDVTAGAVALTSLATGRTDGPGTAGGDRVPGDDVPTSTLWSSTTGASAVPDLPGPPGPPGAPPGPPRGPARGSAVVPTAVAQGRGPAGPGSTPRLSGRRAAALLTLLAALLALGWLAMNVARTALSSGPGQLRPPVVVGLTQAAAARRLTAGGLHVGRISAVFRPESVGLVLAQSPDQHFFVHKGAAVDLTVSAGIERTTVPAVVGLTQAAAEAELGAAGLTVRLAQHDSAAVGGTVLAVQPGRGTALPVHSPVTLVVSTGLVLVPDVRGRLQDPALVLLEHAGFSVGIRPVVSGSPPGTVLAQDVAGSRAAGGSTVVLDVAVAPPAPATPPPAGPTPTPGAGASPTPRASPAPGAGASPKAGAGAAPRPA